MKKLLIAGVCAFGLVAGSAVSAMAEWAPSGPMKMMIAFKAGGGADTQARMIAEALEERHGWKVIPENVTGKGGANLARALKNEPNDGSAFGIAITDTFGYGMVSAGDKAGFTQADFTPLTTTAGFQMGVVALTSKGWNSWDDLVAAAKGGQEIRFGAMSPKLADLAYLLGQNAGIDLNIVMVKGGKGVMNGLNAGDLDIGWGAGIQAKAVKAGDMVNLVSGISSKLVVSPDAPTMGELGIDFNSDGYFLFTAPAGLSQEARDAIASAIGDIVNDPSTKAGGFIAKAFGGPVTISGAELDKVMADAESSAGALMAASE